MAEAMLLKCHADCGASSGDPRACTLACAQRATSGAGAAGYPAGAHATLAAPPARAISPASLSDAEAESILVECHGLCDPDGLVFKGLYAASGTRQQCTMDCAAARMHGESFSARAGPSSSPSGVRAAHLAPPPATAQGQAEMKRVLLKCHAQCAAGGDTAAASRCTMACAQRHVLGAAGNTAAISGSAARANLTAAPRLVASRARPTNGPPPGASAEDEDERDVIFMSGSKRR